jgi:REP element-mobilizing transposase RayT
MTRFDPGAISMTYCQLYYHLVWAIRRQEPLLTAAAEPVILEYIRWKAVGLGGAVFALSGAADHVHLVVSIPPPVSVASFVRQVQAAASTKFNKRSPEEPLHWAEEFGALTFDGKRLPYVITYVERQKEHHAARTLIPVLERTEQPTAGSVVREWTSPYDETGEREWWEEMMAYPHWTNLVK